MPRVTFIKRFDWVSPNGRAMKEFPAGWSGLVTTPQAEAARAAGVLAQPKGGKK